MKYPTVSSLCEGIAESIRRKEGSTEKINPQDFPERIAALQVGGGGEVGNSVRWRAGDYAVEFYAPGLGDGTYIYALFRFIEDVAEDITWEEAINNHLEYNYNNSYAFKGVTINGGDVFVDDYPVYKDLEGGSWAPSFSNPVKATDIFNNIGYYFDDGSLVH